MCVPPERAKQQQTPGKRVISACRQTAEYTLRQKAADLWLKGLQAGISVRQLGFVSSLDAANTVIVIVLIALTVVFVFLFFILLHFIIIRPLALMS